MITVTDKGMTCLQRCFCAALLLCWMSAAKGIDDLHISIENISGEGWQFGGLEVALDVTGENSAELTGGVTLLQYGVQKLKHIKLLCPAVQVGDNNAWSCVNGSLKIGQSLLGVVVGNMSWQFVDAGDWRLQLEGLRFSRARLQLELAFKDHHLHANFRLRNFHLSLLKEYFPPAWSIKGRLDAKGDLVVENAVPAAAKISMDLSDFSLSLIHI